MRAIVAMDQSNGIGYKNSLPWPKNKEDLKWFKSITEYKAIIMGRNTFESLGRLLPNRLHIVITSTPDHFESTENVVFRDSSGEFPEDAIIIGGAKIFDLFEEKITEFLVTRINNTYECDTFFTVPQHLKNVTLIGTINNTDKIYRYTL